MPGVSTEFRNTKDEVTPALKKQREEYERGKKAADGLAAANRRNEQAALSAVNKSLQGEDRLQAVIRGTEQLKKRGVLTAREAARAQQFIREQVDGTAAKRRESERAARAEQKAVQAIANSQNRTTIQTRRAIEARRQGLLTAVQLKNELQKIHGIQAGTAATSGALLATAKSTLASYLGIGAAVAATTAGIRSQLEFEKERARLVQGSAEAETTFAILNRANDPDAQRRRVSAIGARFGFGRDEGERQILFDIAQGLQAARGPEEVEDRELLRIALEARKAGVDIDTARELLVQGVSQTPDDPRQLLRLAFAAGELSGRDPTTIGASGPVLSLFDDKVFAAAVATSIGNVRADDIKTFVQAAGFSLAEGINRRSLGLTDQATGREVLTALRERVDPTQNRAALIADLRQFGVRDRRETNAIIQLLQTFDEITTRFLPEIEQRATPGIFQRARGELEDTSERFRAQTVQDQLAARTFRAQVEGPRALEFQQQDIAKRAVAETLVGTANETFFGLRTVREGQLTITGEFVRLFTKYITDDLQAQTAVKGELEKLNEKFEPSPPEDVLQRTFQAGEQSGRNVTTQQTVTLPETGE